MAPAPLLRALEPPLGSYLRVGRNDHGIMSQLISEQDIKPPSLVFDACLLDRHRDLLLELRRRDIESVLDPRTVELGTPAGFLRSGVRDLPWAGAQPHAPADFDHAAVQSMARLIAERALSLGFSAVLSPTHLLEGSGDAWLATDLDLTRALRDELDRQGGSKVQIYYPLVLPGRVFRQVVHRSRIVTALRGAPIDAVWLRIHSFGTQNSGPIALRGYIEGAQDFHGLGLPLVAERTGTIGLALCAFGAVGGVESGITIGENFDQGQLQRIRPGGQAFLLPPRVYIPVLGLFLTRERAESLFSHPRMKTLFGCQDPACCRRGVRDTFDNPRRHFVIARAKEIQNLGNVPLNLRQKTYLEEFIRPASDRAAIAAQIDEGLNDHRRRLDSWRGTLSAIEREGMVRSWAMAPRSHRLRLAR